MPNHAMKFHPAFHPLLRDGRKTQTRRVVKGVPLDASFVRSEMKGRLYALFDIQGGTTELWTPCPYEIGDTITVEGTDIRLTVTAIRCERLQGISDEDCEAGGVLFRNPKIPAGYHGQSSLSYPPSEWGNPIADNWWPLDTSTPSPMRAAFADLWSCIYPEGPKSWAANPAVWVVEFERLEKEDDN